MGGYFKGEETFLGIALVPRKKEDAERERERSPAYGEVITRLMTPEEWEKYGPYNPVQKNKKMWADQRMLEKAKLTKQDHPITREQYIAYKQQGLKDLEIVRMTPKLSTNRLAELKQLWIKRLGG